jgi:hypothetical protein
MKKAFAVVLASFIMLSPVFVNAEPAAGLEAGKPPAGIEVDGRKNQTTQSPSLGIINPVSGVNSLYGLFNKILGIVVSLSYVVIAVFILLSGFKFITAQGNETELAKAKSMFFWTIIGALLVIGAQVIAEVLKSVITQVAKG